jgi:hypothetical protein
MTPLEMARNAARAVEVYATFQHDDELGAYLARAGDRGKAAAETAACMAMVAIAEDLHRIAELLGATPSPEGMLPPESGGTEGEESPP